MPGPSSIAANFYLESSVYSLILTCDGTTPDVTPHPFTTLPAATAGARTVPIQFGPVPSILPTAARMRVDWSTDINFGSYSSSQDLDCAAECLVNVSADAGLYWRRHYWQDASDNILASSGVEPMVVP